MNRLDIRTKLNLYFKKINLLEHVNIEKNEEKKRLSVDIINSKDAYVFDNYEEYYDFYKMYLYNVDKNLIDLAIYKICKKGQIIALKSICEDIIINQASKEFYRALTDEKINIIHSNNKLSSLDQVKEWEEFDLCAPGDAIGSASNRCKFFKDCHECLLEYASHKEEYEKFDFKLIDYDTPNKVLGKLLK